MSWQNLSFLTSAASAEPLCDALLEAGAWSAAIEDADAGTAAEQPQFGEPGALAAPGWRHSRIVALLDADADVSAVLAAVAATARLPRITDYALEPVAEENWVRLTQAQFAPIRISGRLWIVPSWHDSPDPAAINLVLDPGMAFGTGSHPTTRLCLEWLERQVRPGCSVLDYGCGSGILAIAAARLGAGEVVGVDIDPQAVAAARSNAEKNGVAARFADSAAAPGGEYDLVVANILANPLRLLAPAICARVRVGGCLALSGILHQQAADLIAIYAPWLPLAVVGVGEDWVCLAGQKP